MKTLFTIALLLLPLVACADTSCWTIEDADQRAYCRAVATRSVGQCSVIGDYALRQTCRVRLGANPDSCNSITSAWERQECKRKKGD